MNGLLLKDIVLDKPRITIGIPTFNRPERCLRAIQSVLGQSLPTRCIVANQDPSSDLKMICREFSDHPNFHYYESPATNLWENWRFVAEKAVEEGAEFFGWLQDDDFISERHSRRVVRSFDYFPHCLVYLSRLAMAYDTHLGCHWTGNFGPKIPMDLLRGTPSEFPGAILLPMAYFDGWGMSPAKAFRVGPVFSDMLRDLPGDCDMFTERLDIAYMGMHGNGIADPGISGYWVIHGRNQSQLTHGSVKQEASSCWKWLDSKMDITPGWRDMLMSWITTLGNVEFLAQFRKNIVQFREDSPYIAQILGIFETLLSSSGAAYDPSAIPDSTEFALASQVDAWNKSMMRESLDEEFSPPPRMTGPFEAPEIPDNATAWEKVAVGAGRAEGDWS